MGPLQKGLTPDEGARVVRAALEAGITFIDTATVYRTYEPISRALKGWTNPVALATKTNARADGAAAREHIEMALRAFGREPIDIMLCHCARSTLTEDEWGPTLEALLEAKDKGLIRMVGLSSHSVEGVRVGARHPDIEVIHPLINMAGLGIIDGTAADMLEAIREAKAAGKFLYAMKALAGGNLIAQRREALEYVFGIAEMDVVAVGMVTPAEVEWNVRWAQGLAIEEGLEESTGRNTKRLSILGFMCTSCGACVEHCENDALELVEGIATVDASRCILCGYCAPHCPQFGIRIV
jgi:predicted aldo/keto reductase-like oxidoreductase